MFDDDYEEYPDEYESLGDSPQCGIIPCCDCDHYFDCTSPNKVYDE